MSSAEHELTKEARRELMLAIEAWALSRRDKTLDPEENTLFEKYANYRKLKRITGSVPVQRPKT